MLIGRLVIFFCATSVLLPHFVGLLLFSLLMGGRETEILKSSGKQLLLHTYCVCSDLPGQGLCHKCSVGMEPCKSLALQGIRVGGGGPSLLIISTASSSDRGLFRGLLKAREWAILPLGLGFQAWGEMAA